MFYIEAPAGTGFSVCDKANCSFDDNSTADDNFAAVLYLLETKFPELSTNDLYLSGESYAGIYVPYLAEKMDDYITAHLGDDTFKPNLKGFMVGNGVTNWKYDTLPAFTEIAYYNGLIEEDL
jgi:carboxypeptidase C (cathepsin A)